MEIKKCSVCENEKIKKGKLHGVASLQTPRRIFGIILFGAGIGLCVAAFLGHESAYSAAACCFFAANLVLLSNNHEKKG